MSSANIYLISTLKYLLVSISIQGCDIETLGSDPAIEIGEYIGVSVIGHSYFIANAGSLRVTGQGNCFL